MKTITQQESDHMEGHSAQHNLTEESVIQVYKRYAPLYDWLFGRILQQGRRAIAREIASLRPDNILEVGVGTGLMLPMYPVEIPVTGVDISPEMLKRAKDRICHKQQSRIDLLKVNGEHLPFPDNTFSCVVLPYTYSVTPDPEKLIKEVRRVCPKDGYIIIANHFSGFKSAWNILEQIVSPFTKKIGFNSDFSYAQYIEKIDWEIQKVYPVNLLKLSRLVVIRNKK